MRVIRIRVTAGTLRDKKKRFREDAKLEARLNKVKRYEIHSCCGHFKLSLWFDFLCHHTS